MHESMTLEEVNPVRRASAATEENLPVDPSRVERQVTSTSRSPPAPARSLAGARAVERSPSSAHPSHRPSLLAPSTKGDLLTRESSWRSTSKRVLFTQHSGSFKWLSPASTFITSSRAILSNMVNDKEPERAIQQSMAWRNFMFAALASWTLIFLYVAREPSTYSNVPHGLLWYYVARATHPFSISAVFYIMLCNPCSQYHVVETVSIVMVVFQSAVLCFWPLNSRLKTHLDDLYLNLNATDGPLAEPYYDGWELLPRHNFTNSTTLNALWPPHVLDAFYTTTSRTNSLLPFLMIVTVASYCFVGYGTLRLRLAASQLPRPLLSALVFSTNPKAMLTSYVTMVFFSANVLNCIAHRYENIPLDESPEKTFELLSCEDVSKSTFSLNFAFVCLQFVVLFVIPFRKQEGSTIYSDATMFDISFRQQIMGLLFVQAATFSLYLYATARDLGCFWDWLSSFTGKVAIINKFSSRAALFILTQCLWFLCIAFGLPFFESGPVPTRFDRLNNILSRVGAHIRLALMTRSITKLAPFYRLVCLFLVLICTAILPVTWLVGVAYYRIYHDYTYWQMVQVSVICSAMVCAASAFVFMSNPSQAGGREVTWVRFFFQNKLITTTTIITTSYFVGLTAIFLRFDWIIRKQKVELPIGFIPLWGVMLSIALFLTFFFLPLAKKARDVLSSNTDEKIHEYLARMLSVTVALLPSMFFLTADTIGCVIQKGMDVDPVCTESLPPDQCIPFLKHNYFVLVALVFQYAYFLFSDFCIPDTISEYVKFSKPTLPFLIRLSTMAVASTLTMLVFGSRPDPTIPTMHSLNAVTGRFHGRLDAYLDSAYVVLCVFYFFSFLSLRMFLTKMQYEEDTMLDGDTKSSLEIRISTFLLNATSKHLMRLKVEAGDIRMSPLFRAIFLFIPIVNCLFFVASLLASSPQPGEDAASDVYRVELAAFLARFAETNIPIAFVSSLLYIFSDLNPVRPTVGEGEKPNTNRTKWRTITRDFFILVPCLLSLIQPMMIYLNNIQKYEGDRLPNDASDLSKRDIGVIEIACIFSGFILIALVSVHAKYIICSRFGTKDLEEHLNAVASVAASALPIMCMLCSTANGCISREYIAADDRVDSQFSYLGSKCDTIVWSTRPLYHILAAVVFLHCCFRMFVLENPFSIERMSRLELNKTEVCRVLMIGIAGVVAIAMYGLGGTYGAKLTSAYVFPQQLVWFFIILLFIFEEVRMLHRVFWSTEEIVVHDLDLDGDRETQLGAGSAGRATRSSVIGPRSSVVGGREPLRQESAIVGSDKEGPKRARRISLGLTEIRKGRSSATSVKERRTSTLGIELDLRGDGKSESEERISDVVGALNPGFW